MKDSEGNGAGGKRVALLCADGGMARAIAWALERDGHRVTCGACVPAALDALRAERPDLVLIEARTADGTGLDLCQAIRRDGAMRDVKLLMMQDTGRPVDYRRAAALGADAFLPIPFGMDRLRAEIGRLAGQG